jgi:hypothetical protein
MENPNPDHGPDPPYPQNIHVDIDDIILDPEPMRQAFLRLNLAPIAAQEFINNGIMTPEELRVMTSKHLFRLIKQIHRDNMNGIFIPYKSQQYLEAILYWTNRQYIIGAPYEPKMITQQLAINWISKMKEEQMEKDARTSTTIVKAPESFKKEMKWRPWKESIITYLNAQIGQAGLPLSYIMREQDQPDPEIIFRTTHDELVQCAIHHGNEFDANNGKVYDFLLSLALNGPAWPWIYAHQRTRDGRGSWKALLNYYEGDAMKTRTKQECYQAIARANYQGQRRNYDFNTYVATHQQAHQDLVRLQELIPENKKVRDFLQGITDPQCAPVKLNVIANPVFMNSFMETVNYMASAIDML